VVAWAETLRIEPEIFDDQTGEPVVVNRLSTSGGRHWGINVGTYNSQYEDEKVLLRTALMEIGTLDEALRKVAKTKRGFNANFLGMTEDLADLACRRLTARGVGCTTLGPNG
jgi:D-alanyl-D-alanine carboxypeptidase